MEKDRKHAPHGHFPSTLGSPATLPPLLLPPLLLPLLLLPLLLLPPTPPPLPPPPNGVGNMAGEDQRRRPAIDASTAA